tara:strand:+ start:24 stop:227 length:204 start_codon:yes stop_codon:yes gene_type:complete
MKLNLEKLIQYLEKLDAEISGRKSLERVSLEYDHKIALLVAQRDSFKRLLIDAVEADYSSFMESNNG